MWDDKQWNICSVYVHWMYQKSADCDLYLQPVPLSLNTNFNYFFVLYSQIKKLIITLSGVCASSFRIKVFHREILKSFMDFFIVQKILMINVSMAVFTTLTYHTPNNQFRLFTYSLILSSSITLESKRSLTVINCKSRFWTVLSRSNSWWRISCRKISSWKS